jgi:hypothetical protein
MSAVVSILLLVLGAVLYVAAGLEAVGLILMVVGAVAAAISLWQLVLLVRRGRRPPAQPR